MRVAMDLSPSDPSVAPASSRAPRPLSMSNRRDASSGRRGRVYFGDVAETSISGASPRRLRRGRVAEEAVRLDGVRGGRRDERFPVRVARLYLREDVGRGNRQVVPAVLRDRNQMTRFEEQV